MILKNFHNICNSWSLLSNGNIDAIELLSLIIISSFKSRFLVQDSIDSNSSLSSLSITNDQLSLSSTNWNQHINWLETGLHGLMHWFSGYDTRGFQFNSLSVFWLDGAKTIDGITQSIYNTTEHFFSNRYINNRSSSLHNITFLDISIDLELRNLL
jgi:hypothetical protein